VPTLDDATRALAQRLGATAEVARVVSCTPLSTSLYEVVLAGSPALVGPPGSDVMVAVGAGGATLRRRHSVRRADPTGGSLTLWIGADHDGPGVEWIRGATAGDEVVVIGPRGKITVAPGATWHLFLGDLSAVAVFSRMVESLPAGAHALVALEVDAPDDAVAVAPPGGVALRSVVAERQGRDATDPTGLLRALATLEWPGGEGHAYVFGEFHVVRALRAALVDRGLAPALISHKAYWRDGRANADHGEPDKGDA
jgi:NADPH-dependent ferric siderophore reductase